jgi:hypothetical protein
MLVDASLPAWNAINTSILACRDAKNVLALRYMCAVDILRRRHRLPRPNGLLEASVLKAVHKVLTAPKRTGAARCVACIQELPSKYAWLGCSGDDGDECAACSPMPARSCVLPRDDAPPAQQHIDQPAHEPTLDDVASSLPQAAASASPAQSVEVDAAVAEAAEAAEAAESADSAEDVQAPSPPEPAASTSHSQRAEMTNTPSSPPPPMPIYVSSTEATPEPETEAPHSQPTSTAHHHKVSELVLKWDRTHRSLMDVHRLNDDLMIARLFEDVKAFSQTVQEVGSFIEDAQFAGYLFHYWDRVEHYLPETVRTKDADQWAKALAAAGEIKVIVDTIAAAV